MKLYEYQAKEVFNEFGIPVPNSVLINDLNELEVALKNVGFPCVLKSQLLRGGRGKAGLIQFVKNEEEALTQAKMIFNHEAEVKQILVEAAVDIEKEIYISVTVDANKATGLIVYCKDGGVDIEELARTMPDKIEMENVNLNTGLMPYQINNIINNLELNKVQGKQASKIINGLYKIFRKFDAELVEINPLFITKEGNLVAGDGKLSIDDNSMSRQKRFEPTNKYFKTEAEYMAYQEGIPFIDFGGDIGLMCAGAGLTTTVFDIINYEGGKVANYLEFGGPNYKKALQSMEICLKVPSKVILIVTFGTIARADTMATGIVDAIKKLKPTRPIVTCIRGTNEIEAVKILEEAGLECIFDTEEAVRKAVSLAKGSDNS